MNSSPPGTLVVVLLVASFALAGCDGGCDVGESWCEDDLVMECFFDPGGDTADDECGFLCALFGLADELSDADSYPEVVFDCSPEGKTCHEYEDEDGYFVDCGFRDFDDHLH